MAEFFLSTAAAKYKPQGELNDMMKAKVLDQCHRAFIKPTLDAEQRRREQLEAAAKDRENAAKGKGKGRGKKSKAPTTGTAKDPATRDPRDPGDDGGGGGSCRLVLPRDDDQDLMRMPLQYDHEELEISDFTLIIDDPICASYYEAPEDSESEDFEDVGEEAPPAAGPSKEADTD